MGSNSFVLSPILTDVAFDLNTSPTAIARAISAFGGATALSSFLFGNIIDRVGPRLVLLVGAATMSLALTASSFSQTWYWLASCQAVIGGAVGVMLPAVYATATASVPETEGARILGRVISGWGISLVLGVPASAFLTDLAGWRVMYGALAFFAAVTLLGFRQIPPGRYFVSQGNRYTAMGALTIPGVIPLLFICLLYMTAFYGIYAFLGDHLRTTLNLGAGQAGLVVLGYGAGFILASAFDGLVDKQGPKRVFPVVMLLIGGIYTVLIPATGRLTGAILTAVAWGVVNHIGLNIIILLISQRKSEARGALMGLYTAVTYSSLFSGPLFLGAIYGLYGFKIAALSAAALLFCGSIISWKIKNEPASHRQDDSNNKPNAHVS